MLDVVLDVSFVQQCFTSFVFYNYRQLLSWCFVFYRQVLFRCFVVLHLQLQTGVILLFSVVTDK